jgi:hypothetical protein
MTAIISADDRAKLSRPDVRRCWFGRFDFPDGVKYWHDGVGSIAIGGNTYIGVSDPLSGRMVGVGDIDEPAFGQAASIALVLSGVSKAFVQSVFTTARAIEGRSATVYWAAFDGETQEILTALVPLFPLGKMSAPALHWEGIGRRWASLTIEDRWSSLNFAPGGKWNPVGQHQRFAGDKGLDFVGVSVSENWV